MVDELSSLLAPEPRAVKGRSTRGHRRVPVDDRSGRRLPENKSATVSQVIAAATEAKLIKPDEKVGGSRKYARYLPFWA
jgi:hypothetical protein